MSDVERRPEPELMDDPEQARAYAEADFSEPNRLFVDLFRESLPDTGLGGTVLDLGCGPADIPLRLARLYPRTRFRAVDGSGAMLAQAREAWAAAKLSDRVELIQSGVAEMSLPPCAYLAIISNSLLHHLHLPRMLWSAIKTFGAPGTPVVVMDLQRPRSETQVESLVDAYAREAPPVLRRDFRNSLFAAFTADEVSEQLDAEGLSCLGVRSVSDRHLAVTGRLP